MSFGFGPTPTAGDKLVLQSPYSGDKSLFLNPTKESFSDVVIPLPSDNLFFTGSLPLHRCILSRTSRLLASILIGQPQPFSTYKLQGNQICGLFDRLNNDERAALMEWLRFCYGFDLTVSPSSAPAVLALMLRLQIVGKDEMLPKLETFMVSAAQRSCDTGIDMLQKCQKYCVWHNDALCNVDLRVAKCVFTQANLKAQHDKVVACLMGLPPEFLKEVQYGPQGSATSEYVLRKQYYKQHIGLTTDTWRKSSLASCNFREMTVKEVDKLMDMCSLSTTEKMQLYRLAFASCRNETDIKEACLF